MAKLVVTWAICAFLCGAIFFQSFISSEKTELPEPKQGYGSVLLENSYNPVVQKIITVLFTLAKDLEKIYGSLSTLDIPLASLPQLRQTLASLSGTSIPLNLQYSLLLGIILWPLAILLCPLGYCLVCVVCLCLDYVICLVVIVLLIVGTLLFSGPLAGNGATLPSEATQVVGAMIQTMSHLSNETVDALIGLIQGGETGKVGPILTQLESLVSVFEGLGGQLQASLTHPELSSTLKSSIAYLMTNLSKHLSVLGAQTENLVMALGGAHLSSGSPLRELLFQLLEHIEGVKEKLGS